MCPWCFETRWETILVYGVLPILGAFLIGAWQDRRDARDNRERHARWDEEARRRNAAGQP